MKKCKQPQCLNEINENAPAFCPEHNEMNSPSVDSVIPPKEEKGIIATSRCKQCGRISQVVNLDPVCPFCHPHQEKTPKERHEFYNSTCPLCVVKATACKSSVPPQEKTPPKERHWCSEDCECQKEKTPTCWENCEGNCDTPSNHKSNSEEWEKHLTNQLFWCRICEKEQPVICPAILEKEKNELAIEVLEKAIKTIKEADNIGVDAHVLVLEYLKSQYKQNE